LIDSAQFAVDASSRQNSISIGMPRNLRHLEHITSRLNFQVSKGVGPESVSNRHPRPGEPSEFHLVRYSEEHAVHPGVIACLPTRPEGSRSLLIIEEYPNGLIPLLVSVEGVRALDEQWSRGGSPDGWEMVVTSKVFRETAVKVRPIAFRQILADFWK
jgi:hypothetical protein